MVRLAVYGGISSFLTLSIIAAAFRQRPNFYSACIYLSKSSACIMVGFKDVKIYCFDPLLGINRYTPSLLKDHFRACMSSDFAYFPNNLPPNFLIQIIY